MQKKTSIYVYVLYIYELPTRGESEFETFPNDRFSDLTMWLWYLRWGFTPKKTFWQMLCGPCFGQRPSDKLSFFNPTSGFQVAGACICDAQVTQRLKPNSHTAVTRLELRIRNLGTNNLNSSNPHIFKHSFGILSSILSDICFDTVFGGRVHLHSVASHVRSALKSLTNLLKFPVIGLSATRRPTFRRVRTLVVKQLVGALQPASTWHREKKTQLFLRKPQDKPAFKAKTQLSM